MFYKSFKIEPVSPLVSLLLRNWFYLFDWVFELLDLNYLTKSFWSIIPRNIYYVSALLRLGLIILTLSLFFLRKITTVKIMILSRYRYRPVTVPWPSRYRFLVIVTHRDPSFHHRDTPVPNRPSPTFTVLHRPSTSNTVPHRPTPFKTTF